MPKKVTLADVRKELEGAVSVEGNVTPITRQPIAQITPDRWATMSASELHSQREILCNRYYAAINSGLLDGARTIQAGIMTIDARLEDIGGEGPGFI